MLFLFCKLDFPRQIFFFYNKLTSKLWHLQSLTLRNLLAKNNFNLWWVKMFALLTHQECRVALEGQAKLLVNLTSTQKNVIMKKAYSSILVLLGDEVLSKVY